jgi:hypothetical protein
LADRRAVRSAAAAATAAQWRDYSPADLPLVEAPVVEPPVRPLDAFLAALGRKSNSNSAAKQAAAAAAAAAALAAEAEASSAASLAVRTAGLESETALLAKFAAATVVGAYVIK